MSFIFTGLVNSTEFSVFDYGLGPSFEDYRNLSFQPNFLDEASLAVRQAAEVECGAENIGCVFDRIFTNNSAIASNTKGEIKDQKKTQATLGK